MSEAQINIPEDKKINTESIDDKTNAYSENVKTNERVKEPATKNDAGVDPTIEDPSLKNQATKDETQLADILKPSTLIMALVALVLFILLGWYVYVLKPAIIDNESMIHFMDGDHPKNIHETAALSPNERVKSSSGNAANNLKNGAQTSPNSNGHESPENMGDSGIDTDNNVSNPSNHKTYKNPHRHKSTSASKRSSSSSKNKPECTQAQIALHQCH